MGGKVRRGKARGHGATTLLHYFSGGRVDRRQAHVRAVDRIAEGLARDLGKERFRDLSQAQSMTVFQTAGMHCIAVAFLGEWMRTGDLAVFERFSAAVSGTRRLLASLGLQAADTEELSDLERVLRQRPHVARRVGPHGDDKAEDEGE